MTTAVTSVSATTTSTELLAENGARTDVVITNTSSQRLYVLLATGTASAGNHSFSLIQNGVATLTTPHSYSVMNGVWGGTGGAALITATTLELGVLGADANLGDLKERIASDLERTLTDETHAASGRTWEDEIGGGHFGRDPALPAPPLVVPSGTDRAVDHLDHDGG